ncbi:hypothetical protein JCM30237_10000 [Halolamina litorea]|uniref:PQQ-like domain-containing protein n=1 Tax=Halolamina litorea TaxID=1515593 RepID=A0ABD6BUT1_9EURY|nr:hypothetical protein [Halolamina litorea]
MPSNRRAFLRGVGAVALASPAAATQSAAATQTGTATAPGLAWSHRYDAAGSATLGDLVPFDDGYALVGTVGTGSADAAARGWIGRAGPEGGLRSDRTLGETGTRLVTAVPAQDGLLAVGRTNVGGNDASHRNPYAARVGVDGEGGPEVRWARTYQPTETDGIATAATAAEDGYVLAGAVDTGSGVRPWATAIDDAGTVRWSWRGDGDLVALGDAVATDDGVVLVGSVGDPETPWAVSLDAAGTRRWRWTADTDGGSRLEAATPAPDGGAVIVGRRGFGADDGDGWLLSLDAAGDLRWDRTYSRNVWNWHRDIAAIDGGYALAGAIGDVNGGARSAWVLAVGPEGEERWEYRADAGTGAFAARSVPDGSLLLAGSVDAADGSKPWFARLGGPAATGGFGVPTLPEVPSGAAPFGAGTVVGAAGLALVRRLSGDR